MSAAAETRSPPRLFGFWLRVSPRLVPVFAVITAFLAGIPLITITVSDNALQPDIGAGLSVSSTAYVALVESITGLTINELARPGDFDAMRLYAASNEISTRRSLSRQARPFERITEVGMESTRQYGEFFAQYAIDEDSATAIAERLDTISEVGVEELRALAALLDELADLKRAEVRELAEVAAEAERLAGEALAQASAIYPALADMSAAELNQAQEQLKLIDEHGQVSLMRSLEALALLHSFGIAPGSPAADSLAAIVDSDYDDVVEAIDTLALLDSLGIDDPAGLGAQFRIVGRMYDAEYLSGDSGGMPRWMRSWTRHCASIWSSRRPGNRVLSADDLGSLTFGILKNEQDLEVLFLRLGERVLLFIPSNLEKTIVRAIPFIIAGLAVGLGFKAGLFNIGAEGQLYAGAIAVAALGAFSPPGSSPLVLLPAVILFGILGGFLWGALPGALKAFTGAHEVITTIMLNFIAILLVDWLIKSVEPVLLGDVNASVPKTPVILPAAMLPTMDSITTPLALILIMAAVAVVAFLLKLPALAARKPPGGPAQRLDLGGR